MKAKALAVALVLVCSLAGLTGCAPEQPSNGGSGMLSGLLATTEQAREAAESDIGDVRQDAEAAPEEGSGDSDEDAIGDDSSAGAEAEPQDAQPEAAGEGARQVAGADAAAPFASAPGAGTPSEPTPAPSTPTKPSGRSPSPEPEPEPMPAAEGTISVEVFIDSANAAAANPRFPATLGTFTVELREGGTVYDALMATGVACTSRGGTYVDSIGGIAERQGSSTAGWMYSVDGAFPSKSAMRYVLEGGERIRWAYTVHLGDV